MARNNKKPAIHREWFMSLVKRSCPCGKKKVACFGWGEYRNARWRTIEHFCQHCFPAIVQKLIRHAASCGCSFELVARSGHMLPDWIRMPDNCSAPGNQCAEAYPSIQDKQAALLIQQQSSWDQLSLSAGNVEVSLGRL